MPFITVHYFLDFLEWLDGKYGTQIIKKIEAAFQKAAGPDVIARHPMAYYEAEECDVLLATAVWSGYYNISIFPISEVWQASGHVARFPAGEQDHLARLYTRVLQKILYRRGKGRTLLSKSHLISCMGIWQRTFKDPIFINIIRHPKDVFPSWIALCEAGERMIADWALPRAGAVAAHLDFWKEFYAQEQEFFLPAGEKPDRKIVEFRPFIKNQLETMRELYAYFKLPFEGTPFCERLTADAAGQSSYKKDNKYTNPTLDELSLDESKLDEHFGEYITAMGIAKPSPAKKN